MDRENHAARLDDAGSHRVWLSIIIPTLNEEKSIGRAIRSARQDKGVEILVIDGGSSDRTVPLAQAHGARVVRCEPGRGRQLARGAELAAGDTLLFLHADTRLPTGYTDQVRQLLDMPGTIAGAFRMKFDQRGLSLWLIEWGTCLRSCWRQMPYGDQAIFLRRTTYQRIGGFKPLDAMEDLDLIWRLRRLGRVRISQRPAVTSARKYTASGPWRTVLMHQWMIWSWLIHNRKSSKRQFPTVPSTDPPAAEMHPHQ